MTTANRRGKSVMITDLDQSDSQQRPVDTQSKPHKRRQPEKTLRTITGSFNRRARSAECHIQEHAKGGGGEATKNTKAQKYLNELLHSKDEQMEKLLERIATLYKFNNQFSEENRKLREDVRTLDECIAQLRKDVADCSQCRRLSKQLAKTLSHSKGLETDIEMMKTLVYRLNVQIESYQDRLRHDRNRDGTTHTNSEQQVVTTPSHISNWNDVDSSLHANTLAPLLLSYDEMIRDKEDLIQQYRQEFDHFTGQLKSVLEENNRLLQQNDALKRDHGTWREERTRLQAQLDVCRQKAEAQTRKSDLAKEKLVEVMHCYEQKTQSLLLDMEHLRSAYTRCKSELASLKSATCSQTQDAIVHSLQDCKAMLEQLKHQHTNEKQALERTIVELNERQSTHIAKTEQLRSENHALKRELEQERETAEELRQRTTSLQRSAENVKQSRDRLKARLRIALQWAQKMEDGQANIQSTWDALKRLEMIVKHKESQIRGLHARHLQEIDKMQKKLTHKEETIRTILRGKLDQTTVQ